MSRFIEEQIIAMIQEQEAGLPTTEVSCKHGFWRSSTSCKAKHGGLEVSDARGLRQSANDDGTKRSVAQSVQSARHVSSPGKPFVI